MRGYVVALLLIGNLAHNESAKALDCDTPMPYHFHRAPHADEVTAEQERQDKEARAVLARLDRKPIIFRGRLVLSRYLSDPRKGNVSVSLLVFDHVELMKGRLWKGSADRKAFLIKWEWCDATCSVTSAAWPRRYETVVVGAHANNLPDRKSVTEFDGKRVIYKGRIDATSGMCDAARLTSRDLELLSAPEDEIARLKRDYVPREAY